MTIAKNKRQPYWVRIIRYYKQCFKYLISNKSFDGFRMYKIGTYLKKNNN